MEARALVLGRDVMIEALPFYLPPFGGRTASSVFLEWIFRGEESAIDSSPKIIIAEEDFGVGTYAPCVMEFMIQAGVKIIVARTFAPDFLRSIAGMDLELAVSADASEYFVGGELLTVDFDERRIISSSSANIVKFEYITTSLLSGIRASGGLVAYGRKCLNEIKR